MINTRNKVNVIGAGIGGLATAIRLAVEGFDVTIFEKNDYPGGKLSEISLNGYRFDKGPSLLTLPTLIDELTTLSGYPTPFQYEKLQTITHYFYEDGTRFNATSDIEVFAETIHNQLGESRESVLNYLKRSKFYYDTTADLFLNQSLSQLKNFINLKTIKGILKSPNLGLFSTMHEKNAASFQNEKTIQLFNRYATYNGSNPYKAPALMNIISHLEFGLGAYVPINGMHQITEHLLNIAHFVGVDIKLNQKVEEICVTNGSIVGLNSNGDFYPSDIVTSDIDIHAVYSKLLPQKFTQKKLLNQEKSSSAYVFYWGISKEFSELGLHNILFSNDYKHEFDAIFNGDEPCDDPTIYINISAKKSPADAPKNAENWFVMVNVPHNKHKGINYGEKLKQNVLRKINRMLHTTIEKYIEVEHILDPIAIEKQTSSFGGSLYGNSSNNRFSAFLRHSNFSSKINNLYFVGGSVHPGGGIPLCLLSAKITSEIISSKIKK